MTAPIFKEVGGVQISSFDLLVKNWPILHHFNVQVEAMVRSTSFRGSHRKAALLLLAELRRAHRETN